MIPPISPQHFLTLLLTSAIASLTATAAPRKKGEPWYSKPQPRFAKTDLGRVFSGTINLQQAPTKPTLKGLAIQVGHPLTEGHSATIIYDTELLRPSGAIPNRSVMFNTYRDGLGGSGHWVGPPYFFITQREPGWAREGNFDDPRKSPHGPLPQNWAKYKGLYRHGHRAVLSYTVGSTDVLESPWTESHQTTHAITRTFLTSKSSSPLHLKLLDIKKGKLQSLTRKAQQWIIIKNGDQITAAAAIASPSISDELKLSAVNQSRIIATIPPHTEPAHLKILTWSGDELGLTSFQALVDASQAPENLTPYTEPGPRQWTEQITTQGKLGRESGAYTVDTLTPPFKNPYNALMTFAGHDFFSNGDAAICTIHGDVWRVTRIDQKLEELTWHRYATGLFQPLGLKIVDDKVYVLGRDQITRLHDNNNDHETDYYENFNNDCKIGTHVHEYTTSLETDPDGNFYYNKGNNGGQTEHDGSLIRVSRDGTKFDVFATGFRWPNGGGAGPDGTITVADQQGTWVPASRLDVIKQGGFYGYMFAHHRETKPETYDGPLCWIPHSIDNSCGGQTWVTGGKWGPLDGYMIHLSYGKCSPFLVLEQTIGDTRQAGVVPFGLKFQSGAMRARFHPVDGQLYVSGLKGWQTSAARDGCFERVRYTGKPLRIPTGLSVHENGLQISFPRAFDPEILGDPESWAVEQWNYRWTKAYGSKEYKVSDPDQTGHDPLEIQQVRVSKDARSVFLEIDGLAPVMQMKVQYDLGIVDGKKLRGAIHNTIHKLAPPLATTK